MAVKSFITLVTLMSKFRNSLNYTLFSEDPKAKVETLFEKWFDNENKDNTELERAKRETDQAG